MGIGGIGIWQLLIILVIVLLLFGTKKLKNLGGDLGGAIRGFKKAVNEDKSEDNDAPTEELPQGEGAENTANAAKEQSDSKPS